MGLGSGIRDWYWGFGIGILDKDWGLGIGDWDWGLEIGIGDWDWGLGTGGWDWRLGIGRMTNVTECTLHFVLMRMKVILFLHIMLELFSIF